MKKLIALVLAVLMILSLAACNTTPDTPSTTNGTNPPATTGTVQTDPPAPRELHIGIRGHANTEDYETNAYTLWLEEATNIDLTFTVFSPDVSEANQQLSLMIAGNETLPDVLLGFDLAQASIYEYGADGYFLDLRDYIENKSVYLKENLTYLSELKYNNFFAYGTSPIDGGYYSLPGFEEQFIDVIPAMEYINTVWLEKVGKTMPTNVDELYDVLKAFATQDPNGNGKVDEIPALGGVNGYRTDIGAWIVNAFVFVNDAYFFNVDGGKLWVPYTTDEYREAMKYLHKLSSEGLLSPLTYTLTSGVNGEIKKLATPEDGVSVCGIISGHPTLILVNGAENAKEYAPIPTLKDETGKGGFSAYRDDAYTFRNFITTDCANPDLAFELLDFMYSTESFYRARYGVEGKHWVKATEGMMTSWGQPAAIEILDGTAYGEQNNYTWHRMDIDTAMAVSGNGLWGTAHVDDGSWASWKSQLCTDLVNTYADAPVKTEVVYTLIYTAEENEQIADVSAMVKEYMKEARALFATGGLDPNNDADWQTYLDTIEGKGLSQWLEVAQAAYDRMNG